MQIDFNTYLFGARLFYWIYLFLTLLGAGGVVLYWQRETIRKKFYEIRFPEKLIKINIIYPGNMIRYFYRLIPDESTFSIEGGVYDYSDTAILKDNSWYAFKENKEDSRLAVKIGDKTYYLDDRYKLKQRWERWPQIFYKFNNPLPLNLNSIIIDGEETKLKFNSDDLKRLKESTILTQIYNTMAGTSLIIIILVVVVIIMIIAGCILAKVIGWIK